MSKNELGYHVDIFVVASLLSIAEINGKTSNANLLETGLHQAEKAQKIAEALGDQEYAEKANVLSWAIAMKLCQAKGDTGSTTALAAANFCVNRSSVAKAYEMLGPVPQAAS